MSAGYAQRLSEYPNKVRSELLSQVDFFFEHLILNMFFLHSRGYAGFQKTTTRIEPSLLKLINYPN